MKKEEVDLLIQDCKKLLNNCDDLCKEIDEMKRCVDFLINEYRTNKRYFREEPGRETTIEDVIKTCFEFGWASKRNYDYNKTNEECNLTNN